MQRSFLPIDCFLEDPYSQILAYPKPTKRQIISRIKELKKIGVNKVAFYGPTRIGMLDVLGKGYVGMVVLGKRDSKLVAIKIRRVDSQRKDMINETRLLQKANSVSVGPKFVISSKNFLVMEYVDGLKIIDWVNNLKGKGSVSELKKTLRKILEDCFKLDSAGFDHGELSSIAKHVIIGKKISLIDFESSSVVRRPSNVTSATQSLFIGSGIAKIVSRAYKVPTKKAIIEKLRSYKAEPSQENFYALLKILKL